ncbi:lysozyme [Lichenihabitans psoromatis]|uniref:lysozyme n=1 Tax=Lichenihabitans psoromatis TaxID=2528642 RepID=UPI001036A241|nr:lysozyme [Lichenihabitans psoromatis]
MTLSTSAAGRATLMAREGCRLTAYRDSVGVLTIGVGHTGRATLPRVTAGMMISQTEAETIFASDLAPFEAAVKKAITRAATQNQFDAMVSLAFNIGSAGFRGSSVVRRFNAGDLGAAADAFLLWNKAGGRVVAGLAKRRAAERAQFLIGDPIQYDAACPPASLLKRLWLVFLTLRKTR